MKGEGPRLIQAMSRRSILRPDLSKQAAATQFLSRSWLLDMSTISMLLSEMNAFGGSKEESQLTANQGLIEQPEFKPMPKGYSTVMFPHLLSQLGLAMLLLLDGDRERRRRKREKIAGVRDITRMAMEKELANV